jgi:DNA-directed RNA polymerase subunit RPC12/RpoP
MTPAQHSRLVALFMQLVQPRSTKSVSEWCSEHIRFNEPKCTGPFSFHGREYLREPLNCCGDDDVTDITCVMATRTGKTRICYGGLAWIIANDSVRALYVKAKSKGPAGAEDDARTRFIPMLRASPVLAAMIPGGIRRHDFKTAQQIIGSSIVDWTGSNSASSLASNPCRVVIQDEVDKFNTTRKRDDDGNVVEADASALADERCKEFSNPKRFKVSTPTLPNGLIWQSLMKSDLRRFFVPCPHCGKHVVFAWSKDFSVLPATGNEAFVRWDDSAKRDDGTWDFERVEATAHAECPHCHGKILDMHKAEMIRRGEWRPTQTGAPGHHGYHLPSMYASHRETNFGRMAVRFLQACTSPDGPRGFINSDLAEPYASQDFHAARIERVSNVEVLAEWVKQMTVDVQQKAPNFWHIIRAFGGREIVGLKGGPLDSWDDVRAAQVGAGVKDAAVIIDSGYGSKEDAGVYRECAQYGEMFPDPATNRKHHLGWTPAKGWERDRRWRDKRTGIMLPFGYTPIDPYMGTSEAGVIIADRFDFAADFFKDVLQRLREGRDPNVNWTISKELDNDEYHTHMRGQVKREVMRYNRWTTQWMRRHRHAPDHLFACEVMQVAAAAALGLIVLNEEKKK